jgi:hypothetical protein
VNKPQHAATPTHAPHPTATAASNGASSNGASHGAFAQHAAPQQLVQPTPAQHAVPVDGWVFAYQEAQRQTAEAHTAFQNAMAQAHIAFLQTAERGLIGLTTMASGMPTSTEAPSFAYMPQALTTPQPMAVVPSMPVPRVQPQAPQAPHVVQAPPVAEAPPVVQTPVVAEAAAVAQARVATPPAASSASPANGAIDAEALLLEVVADKTGYPVEMLAMDMALEADLGIDSIKRVEILSAMLNKQPNLPQVNTKEMAALNTLGEIVSYMNAHVDGASAEGARPKASAASSAASP